MRRLAGMAIALGTLAGAHAAAAQDVARMLNEAAFSNETYAVGKGPVLRRSGAVKLSGKSSLEIGVGGVLRTPAGLPLNLERGQFDGRDVDVTLVRRWPGAVAFRSDGLQVEVAPHAGLGVSRAGGQAVGGATLTVSKSRTDAAVERLKALGVDDGADFGETGRWYLFAAASGRAVGLNMLHGERGWDRAGWSTDPTASLVGDAQVGVGWRKGDMQTSFGVVHREVKGAHMIFGQETRNDTVAAFTFSIRPGR
jgi:hypothetical protein